MKSLINQPLQLCDNSSTALSRADINLQLGNLNGWVFQNINDTDKIVKEFKFKDFIQALAFTNSIADLAEQENHHPKISLEWGRVTISWWTHSVNGLYINDFIMAAKCDVAYIE